MIAITTLLAVLFAYPALSSGKLLRRQDLSGVPACGQTCLITAATNPAIVGSCSLTDVSCLCKNDKFQSSVTSCALSTCSTQDQQKMLTWASATCPASTSAPAAPAPSVPSAYASELAGLPACGQNCLVDSATNTAIVGSCSPTDTACLCGDSKFMGAVTQCVASKCSFSDASTMLTWSTTACSAGASQSSKDSAAAQSSKGSATSTIAAAEPTSTVAAATPSQTPVAVNSSYLPSITNTTVSASGNSASAVTVTYTTSVQSTKPTSVAKAGDSSAPKVQTTNSTESTSPATALTSPGCFIVASLLIPTLFL